MVKLRLPMLKERKDDIPLLAEYFLEIYNKEARRSVFGFSSASIKKLSEYDWPGNTRELENVIQKAVLFGDKEFIGEKDIDIASLKRPFEKANSDDLLPIGDARALNQEHLQTFLKNNNGIVSRAASEAGIARSTFYQKLREFNLRA